MITQVNCKICLKSAGLHKGICWFCVAFFEGTSLSKNASTLMVCLGKKKFGSTSPCIVRRLVIPVLQKYLHLFSLSKQKSFVDLLKLAVTGKFRSMFLTRFGKNKWFMPHTQLLPSLTQM